MDRYTKYKLIHQWYSKGKTQQEIADLLSVSQPYVSRILKLSLDNLPKWGGHRKSKLTDKQKEELIEYLNHGAETFGFAGDYWSGKRVQKLIEEKFGVSYHFDSVPDLLHTLGFSFQKPKRKDARQNEQKIENFIEATLPEIKKKQS